MMNIPLHSRIAGKPDSSEALRGFMKYRRREFRSRREETSQSTSKRNTPTGQVEGREALNGLST